MARDNWEGCDPKYIGKVYVGGIGADVTRSELEAEYSKFGSIRDVWIAHNPAGFAFVEFHEERDGRDAIRATDGARVCGYKVSVEASHGRKSKRKRYLEDVRCYNCNRWGHLAKVCTRAYGDYRRSRSPPRRDRRRSRSRSPRRRRRSRSRSRSRSPRRRSRSRSPHRSKSRSRERSKRRSRSRSKSRSKDRRSKSREGRSKSREGRSKSREGRSKSREGRSKSREGRSRSRGSKSPSRSKERSEDKRRSRSQDADEIKDDFVQDDIGED